MLGVIRSSDIDYEIVPDMSATAADRDIAARLLAAYHACIARAPAAASGVWGDIEKQQATFLRILRSNDPAALASYLLPNMNRQDATIRNGPGMLGVRTITLIDAEYRRFVALMAQGQTGVLGP